MKYAMQTKYALINYYYTEISMIHEEGGAFYKPLFFEFPYDDVAYYNQTHNIMLGEHLKLSIQSTENGTVTETDYYFPQGKWCSVFNVSAGCIVGPANVTLPSRIYQSYVHIRDGSIVPLQTELIGEHSKVTKVAEVQQNPVDLHILPRFTSLNSTANDGSCSAAGRFLNDDGIILDYQGRQNRYQLNFSAACAEAVNATNITLTINQTA